MQKFFEIRYKNNTPEIIEQERLTNFTKVDVIFVDGQVLISNELLTLLAGRLYGVRPSHKLGRQMFYSIFSPEIIELVTDSLNYPAHSVKMEECKIRNNAIWSILNSLVS